MITMQNITNKYSERGATLAIFALCLIPFMIFIGYAMNISYLGYVQGQLQTATDAGAHAGTASLCSSKKCWDESIKAAQTVIAEHIMPATFGSYDSISFPKEDSANSWNVGKDKSLNVTIERGWVTKKGFESLEGSWQSEHSGLPRFVIANAVRVTISRFNINPFLSVFNADAAIIKTVSVAQKGVGGTACIAPFALHVCSILNKYGEFQSDGDHGLCAADRIFGSIDITNKPKPGFFYDPTPYTSGVSKITNDTCIWVSPSYGSGGQLVDNYGVIGIPKGESTSEDDIRNNHLDKNCPYKAEIGDQFVVLSKGFEKIQTGDTLWEQVSNSLGKLDKQNHPTYSSTLGGIEPNLKHYSADCQATGINDSGVCGSYRFGFPNALPSSSDTGCYNTFLGDSVDKSDIDTPVWRTRIPIIADVSSGAYACGESDPGYSTSVKYTIIGFVMVNIFDAHIGANAPDYPIGKKLELDDISGTWISTPCPITQLTCTCLYDELDNVLGTKLEGLFPWGYIATSTSSSSIYGCSKDGMTYVCKIANPGTCNLARARITCDTTFVPTTEPSILGKARLVDQKK